MIHPHPKSEFSQGSQGLQAPLILGSLQHPSTTTTMQRVTGCIRVVVCFVCLVSFLKGTVVEAFMVPSSSMSPTVRPRDYMLVTKFSYGLRLPLLSRTLFSWRRVQRGHIVVFNRPDDPATSVDESRDNLVKRVIAVAGDSLEIVGQEVKVNGIVLSEAYASWGVPSAEELKRAIGPITVPDGYVFVLGDNRAVSRDSRMWTAPFVPVDRVQGQALMVYWSGESLERSGRFLR